MLWLRNKKINFPLHTHNPESAKKNASEKWRLLKSSAANNCLTVLTNLSIEANRVDPDQTAPIGAVWSGSKLFVMEAFEHFNRQENQTTFVAIGALRAESLLVCYLEERLVLQVANQVSFILMDVMTVYRVPTNQLTWMRKIQQSACCVLMAHTNLIQVSLIAWHALLLHLHLLPIEHLVVVSTTIKTVLSGHSKRRPNIGFQDQLSLNAGWKYCRMLQESILQYFWPSISYHSSLRTFVLSFLNGPLTGFTV